ncbi:hypothetical protein [Flavobacterium branchiicola]|uniref:VCBS repeat-containing protein n=1 Tax=Flavobacterium branchiicola TaxID=1114875 RepID=A0ABV9P960_9FLAO|nr:hypothetical protein [Flavobacterium branchiicola]MBS7253679.1 hypothetical protein [Flavobacterium branchiicola]
MRLFQTLMWVLCIGCSKIDNKLNNLKAKSDYSIDVLRDTIEKKSFYKLKKTFCIGDFDGDGKKDTIFEHNFSKLKKEEIEIAPDPIKNDWEEVIKWFSRQDSDLYISFNNSNRDTLHLGEALGLYCLLNIGDNNLDGKDEVAVVVDNLDFSNLNSCKIYSLCKGKWAELKQFNIDERIFDSPSAKVPLFEIKKYLEKKDDKWFFKDNLQNEPEMRPLKISKC